MLGHLDFFMHMGKVTNKLGIHTKLTKQLAGYAQLILQYGLCNYTVYFDSKV